MAFMAANDPNVIVRTVTLPALPAPPAKVIVLDVQHQPAPIAPPVTGPASSARSATPSTNRSTPSGGSAPAASVPARATPAPAAPVAAPTPTPTTKTGPS